MESEINEDKLSIFVGIELEAKKIPYCIFYRRESANPITIEKILDFDNSHFYKSDDEYLKILLGLLNKDIVEEIDKIEKGIEKQIFWIFCVASWGERDKHRLREFSFRKGLINSVQDKKLIILEKGIALTCYFEKEKNINIKVGKPYIIIIAEDIIECLEKTNIEKNKIGTAIINHFYYLDLGKALYSILCQIEKEGRNDLKILFCGSEEYYSNFVENQIEKELGDSTQVSKVDSLFAVSKGAIYYCSKNNNIPQAFIAFNNVYQNIDNNVIFNTKINTEKKIPKVIVSIDFGSSGIDYCFAFNKLGDIKLNYCRLPGTEGTNCKSPSEIIIDEEFNKIRFGVDCKEYISQIKEKQYFFKNIKMHLYENKTEIQPENSDEKFPINIIIAKILTEVKTEALNKIKNYDENINDNDIKWVVTVPAIWNDINKQIMIEASLNAGLIDRNSEESLFLSYEPEAAAYYCQYEGILIPENKTYIVCDLGGGTVDIVCHMKIRINNRIKIKETHEPVGGPYGANEINKVVFNKVIIPFFGKDVYEETLTNTKKEYYIDLFNFESRIQYFKESLSSKFSGIFQRKNIEDSKITEYMENNFTLEPFIEEMKIQCQIEGPFKLDCTLFKYYSKNSLEELTNKFNEENNNLQLTSEVKKRGRDETWFIFIPYEIILDITIDFVNKTCKKIEEILDNPGDMDIKSIDSILYVGGYFSSQVVYWLIKKKLNEIFLSKGLNTIRHILVKEPKLAVVKGATLYGLNPEFISSRKSTVTLGIKCLKNGRFFFDKFLNIGDDILPEKEEKHSFKMHGNQFATFELMACNIRDPDPYNENLFTHHCTLIPLDIGNGHNEGETIELRMKIGTYINCLGYYENEEKINVRVDFMSNISHPENKDFDILYMIDGTGSMKSYIEAAKTKCIEISEELEKTYREKLNFKYGVIFYRDPIDEQTDRHEPYPLDYINIVREKIEPVKAYGGGDGPEDWVGAFKIALDSNIIKWREGIKLIIHIADAPAHGDEFAGKINYTDEGPKLIEKIRECVERDIKIFGLFIGKSAENSFLKCKEYYDNYDRENKGLYRVVNFNEGEGRDIAEKFKSLVLHAVHTIEPLDN